MKELYKTLKDHRNSFMQNLVTSSYQAVYRKEAQDLLHEILSSQDVDDCGTENVVRVRLVNTLFRSSLSVATSKLMEAKLVIDQFGLDDTSEELASSEKPSDEQQAVGDRLLSDKLTVLINDIDIAMKTLGYGLYRGNVYKKEQQGKYTYSYKCEAREFVGTLASNEHFKARLLKGMKKVTEILSDPYCEAIRPLKIDYNLIEVMGGQCWSVKERQFVVDAVDEANIGRVSPRAFCPYDPSTPPEPKFFREILENSLTESELAEFCEDFLKLLHCNKKRHKDKVPCLVGEANSGKTSLFMPILGIVHHSNIATVTKQRSFNKAMITKFTEVVFIDEATEAMLDVDDWKILTQGGYTAHDVKYETAKSFINRCPMLVTAQRRLKFAEEDQPAMDRRLRFYMFKGLPRPRKGASVWLKRHAMDCIAWAATKARSFIDDVDEDEQAITCESEEDVELAEAEKDELRLFPLPEVLGCDQSASQSVDEPIILHDDSEVPDSDGDEGTAQLQHLQHLLGQSLPGTLKNRQLQHLLAQASKKQEAFERLRREWKETEKQALIDEGLLSSTEVHELRQEAEVPAPLRQAAIERRLKKGQKEQEEEQNRIKESIEESFKNQWLRNKEIELFEQQYEMTLWVPMSPEWQNFRSLIEVNANKIRMFHEKAGSGRQPQHALECRRKMLLELKLITLKQVPLIRRLNDLPPTDEHSDADADDEPEILITSTSVTTAIPKPLEDYSDPAAWGGLPVRKTPKRRSLSQANTQRVKKSKATSTQASGQRAIDQFFKS